MDYFKEIQNILNNPDNKLTENSRESLEKIIKKPDMFEGLSDEEIDDLQKYLEYVSNNYFKDKNYTWDGE